MVGRSVSGAERVLCAWASDTLLLSVDGEGFVSAKGILLSKQVRRELRQRQIVRPHHRELAEIITHVCSQAGLDLRTEPTLDEVKGILDELVRRRAREERQHLRPAGRT